MIPFQKNSELFGDIENDDVWTGIFFLETDPKNPKPIEHKDERVGALAFMIRADGLLVTCAHVPTYARDEFGTFVCNDYGDELTLRSAILPVTVRARVLSEGWSGPPPSRWRKRLTPDEWEADICFLQLLLDTVAPIPTTADKAIGIAEARACLLDQARVLPIAAPNYSVGSKQPLRVHQVTYSAAGFPRNSSAIATFRAVERRLNGGTVSLDSEVIESGDSGGPVWDSDRRRVVAMVRSGMGHQSDSEFAADARVISELSGVPVQIDADAQSIVHSLDQIAQATSLTRHFPILQSWMHTNYVELRVAAPIAGTDFWGEKEQSDGQPASLGLLKNAMAYKGAILLGSPGAGKSRLMYQLSRHLLDNSIYHAGKRVLPLNFHARDFQAYGLNIRDLVETGARRTDLRLSSERSPFEVLSINDIALMVLIDGLDEIDQRSRTKLVRQVTQKVLGTGTQQNKFSEIYSDDVFIVVASRPVEDVRLFPEGLGPSMMPVLELQPLNTDEIDKMISSRIEDETRRVSVREIVEVLDWLKSGPTPLQLSIALGLATAGNLEPDRPARPIDLNFKLIDHLVALGRHEDDQRRTPQTIPRSSIMQFLERNIRPLLQVLGENFINGTETLEKIHALNNITIEGREDLGPDVRDFVERERWLLGAILAIEKSDSGEMRLVWPHRAIPEALSAEYHKVSAAGHVSAFSSYQRLSRERSDAFELQFLSLIDGSQRDQEDYASQLVSLKLEREHMQIETTWFALRLLAAGVVVRDDVFARLVAILLKLLASNSDDHRFNRAWLVKCLTLFSTSSAPSPVAVAQLPSVRPFLIERLNATLERRARVSGIARLTSHEENIIEMLSLWGALTVPTTMARPAPNFVRPVKSQPASVDKSPLQSRSMREVGELRSFDYAFYLLARDPNGFASAFNEFLEMQPVGVDPIDSLDSFIVFCRGRDSLH